MKWRQWLLVAVLCVIAGGGVLAFERSQVIQPAVKDVSSAKKAVLVPAAESTPVAAPTQVTEPEKKHSPRVIMAQAEADLFASKSWYVAPPPPPPPKPVAPPFPYQYAGSMQDGDELVLFVTLGQRNYLVRKGDLLGGNYRLDEVDNHMAVFTYLPLKEQQRLQIGTNN
jgi:hypothetical protein